MTAYSVIAIVVCGMEWKIPAKQAKGKKEKLWRNLKFVLICKQTTFHYIICK